MQQEELSRKARNHKHDQLVSQPRNWQSNVCSIHILHVVDLTDNPEPATSLIELWVMPIFHTVWHKHLVVVSKENYSFVSNSLSATLMWVMHHTVFLTFERFEKEDLVSFSYANQACGFLLIR